MVRTCSDNWNCITDDVTINLTTLFQSHVHWMSPLRTTILTWMTASLIGHYFTITFYLDTKIVFHFKTEPRSLDVASHEDDDLDFDDGKRV